MSQPLSGVSPSDLSITANNTQPVSSGEAQSNFSDLLKDTINGVNSAQEVSNQKKNALASGQIDDLHDVMVTAQKAGITLETSTEIQNKVIDAYNEVMRMQV